MPLVVAKCTSCGAVLKVDNSKDAAICEFCGVPYIVEKAINNYNFTGNNNISVESAVINIQGSGPTIENILKRAEQFEKECNITKALEYYDWALDLDITNEQALCSIDRIKNSPVAIVSITSGFIKKSMVLTRTNLIIKSKRIESKYPINDISSVSRLAARLLIEFVGQKLPLNIAIGKIKDAKLMEKAINDLIKERILS